MRTLLDLPEADLKQLNELGRARKTSRTQLIRLAVTGFLTQNRPGVEDSFGFMEGPRRRWRGVPGPDARRVERERLSSPERIGSQ